MTKSETLALRALRDCGVIRSHASHQGFSNLRNAGLAVGLNRRVGEQWRTDWRLTDKGAQVARVVLS